VSQIFTPTGSRALAEARANGVSPFTPAGIMKWRAAESGIAVLMWGGTDPTGITVSGGGATWVSLGRVVNVDSLGARYGLEVFVTAAGALKDGDGVTFTWTNAPDVIGVFCASVQGIEGFGALIATRTSDTTATTGGLDDPSIALQTNDPDATTKPANAVLAFISHWSNIVFGEISGTIIAQAGITGVSDIGVAGVILASISPALVTIQLSTAAAGEWAMIAIEARASGVRLQAPPQRSFQEQRPTLPPLLAA
jgi:hypothetical protein